MSETVFGIPITMFDFDEKEPMFSEYRTVSIIPANATYAKFRDGNSVPVIAWANQVQLVKDENGTSILQRVIGLVICLENEELCPVDSPDVGEFETYE